MAAKHWAGLIVLVLFVNLQSRADGWWFIEEVADGWRFNLGPAPAAATGDADEQRDGVTCFSPDDCQKDECCLANVRSISKISARTKRWFFVNTPSEGVCQKLASVGSSCIVPFSRISPDPSKQVIALDMCPCATEFSCVAGPDAPIVDPQGKIGSCEVKKSEPENTGELFQLLSEKVDDEAAADNDDAETDNDAPSEDNKVYNDDNDNDNADEIEPLLEEGEQVERKEEEEQKEEEPLENTIDDFPADPED